MNTYSYVGWVEVVNATELKSLKENWLTDIYPYNPGDNAAAGRMPRAIFQHCNVVPNDRSLPAPGFYKVKAQGLLEFGCNSDGGTCHVVLEKASYEPAPEHQMRDWFINPQPRRPVFLEVTIQSEPE